MKVFFNGRKGNSRALVDHLGAPSFIRIWLPQKGAFMDEIGSLIHTRKARSLPAKNLKLKISSVIITLHSLFYYILVITLHSLDKQAFSVCY